MTNHPEHAAGRRERSGPPTHDDIPATAGGVIVNDVGDVLLVSQFGTSWSFPKGHVDAGETRLQTAYREIYEETGLSDLHLATELTTYKRSALTATGACDESQLKEVTLYLFHAAANGQPTPHDPDNPDARWFPPAVAEFMLTHPRDRLELRRLRSRLPPTPQASPEEHAVRCIRAIAPECPVHLIDQFVTSLSAASELLASQAVLSLDKPYGVNHVLVAEGKAGLSFARLLPQTTSSQHVHTVRTELFWVRCGELTLRSGDDDMKLRAGDIGFSVPGRPHAIANEGREVVEIVEVFSPALLSDKVRLSDRYGRRLGPVDVAQ